MHIFFESGRGGGEKLLPHYDKNKITAFFSFIKTLYIGGA